MKTKIKVRDETIAKGLNLFELITHYDGSFTDETVVPSPMYALFEKVGSNHINLRFFGMEESMSALLLELGIAETTPFLPVKGHKYCWENVKPIYSKSLSGPLFHEKMFRGFVENKTTGKHYLGGYIFCACEKGCTWKLCINRDHKDYWKNLLADRWCKRGWPEDIELSDQIAGVIKRVSVKLGILGGRNTATEKTAAARKKRDKQVKLPAVVIDHLKAEPAQKNHTTEPTITSKPTTTKKEVQNTLPQN